ncbi:SPOSA6832_03318 [Sporobolomyces salmonicolor]|uniref:SPOSA6832_03318-mRNA-1:cds n=1 Tax=Sporidiobolus salmonicolor TaxID=5005 RepID=A0A0D6EPR7_SPOSA|nr:SPOSA6832_03318 [Sporobolomyces salmonicolor]
MAAAVSASPSSLRQRTTPVSSSQQQLRAHSGHSHSHSHPAGAHNDETEALSSAFRSLRKPSSLDPGSRITLVGLFANVGLTALKGVAGYVLASSALLADAAHSGSDLIADVVTLVSYRVGRWEPTRKYPYGYGKFESLGSLVVSFLLFATAAGIGLHSYHHLLLSLSTIPSIPPDLLASLDFLPHGHSHGPDADPTADAGIVDARAMWFAAGSIAVKEWLYRATLKVAHQTHSNVLLANAYHHRSDSLGSLVALLAIGAARVGLPMLDPVGGIVVGGMIAKQGWDVGKQAVGELVDRLSDPKLPSTIHDAVAELRDPSLPPLPPFALPGSEQPSHPHSDSHSHSGSHSHTDSSATPSAVPPANLPILAIPSIRLFSSGPSLLIDILLHLPPSLTVKEATEIEERVRGKVREVVGRVRCREVVVRMRAGETGQEEEEGQGKDV